MPIRIFYTLIVLLFWHPLLAQQRQEALHGVVVDSAQRTPLAGASVTLLTPRDTISLMTNPEGVFSVHRLRDTSLRIHVAYLGYRNITQQITLKPKETHLDTLALSPSSYELEEAIVRGERPLMGQRGDTLLYHPESIRLLPGDASMELIFRLPGMEVKDGKITVMGRVIERTYVDGRPLFGEDAQSALTYLEARDVIDIQVYDEQTEEEKIKQNPNGKKRTVMNLITQSKPEKSINLYAIAGYGADMDRGVSGNYGERYNTRASANYFSEQRSMQVSTGINNSNKGSGYNKNTYARAGFSKRWKKSFFLEGNYNYTENYNRSQSVSRQVYFPTQEFQSRIYDDTSRRINQTRNHTANISFRHNTEKDFIYFSPNIQFTQGNANSYRGALQVMDDKVLNRVATTQQNGTRSYNLSEYSNWSHTFDKGKHVFNISLNGTMRENDDQGWQIDSLSSTTGLTYLKNTASEWNRNLSGHIGYSIRFKKKHSIGLNYNLSYENSKSQRMAVDLFTGRVDTSLTYDYSRNYTTQSSSIHYNYFVEKLYITLSTAYQSARLNKNEILPKTQEDQITFRSIQPSASVNYTLSPTKQMNFTYSSHAQQPGIEQLRNELNYENPLHLLGGNPNLQQSYTHSVQLNYNSSKTEKSRTFNIHLNANVSTRNITIKQVFFTEETPLPAYNGYIATQGSTLTTPVNVNGAGSLETGASVSQLIKAIQSTLSIHTGFGYTRQPSYIGEQLNYTNNLSPRIGFNLTSNQSTVYQFSIYTNLSYNHSANSHRADNSSLTQNVNADVTVNFLKKCYVRTSYNYSLYHNFSYADGDVNNHLLNLTVGCKLFEKRQADINFTLYDLLNRTDNFSTRMMADYISYNWNQRTGRYFMFNLSYRFNKTGKLKQKKQ